LSPTEPDPKTLSKARAAALRLLAHRDRATRELADRLLERFPQDIVDTVMAQVTGLGYLNDERLAERLVEELIDRRHFGPRRIRQELKKRKLSPEAMALGLAATDDRELVRDTARAATRAFFKGRPPAADPGTQRRLAGYLGRRGFSDATIRDMLADIRQANLAK